MVEAISTLAGKRVWVAGHRGLAGSAIVRRLGREQCEILTLSRDIVDLRRQDAVEQWLLANRPDVVVLAAATVGGILANSTRPAEFLYDNLVIETNVIHGAYRAGVSKLLFLGSSCIYPREAALPISETSLLTGPLEPTNEWYAIAKIAGIKLGQAYRRQYGCDFISAMPTNLYGPGDRFDLTQGHVVASLIMKFQRAVTKGETEVVLWGSGTPLREFLHVDDFADACVFLLNHYSDEPHVNIGTGIETSIRELAEMLIEISGFKGKLVFDPSKPDGTPRKVMDVARLKDMGWQASVPLRRGLADAYQWYAQNIAGRLA